ncbi:MAG TPA: hypothetical protein PLO55_12440 [Thermotogota bacterium]|nr:hypothetical protein [Thermotogota bacterium]
MRYPEIFIHRTGNEALHFRVLPEREYPPLSRTNVLITGDFSTSRTIAGRGGIGNVFGVLVGVFPKFCLGGALGNDSRFKPASARWFYTPAYQVDLLHLESIEREGCQITGMDGKISDPGEGSLYKKTFSPSSSFFSLRDRIFASFLRQWKILV